MPESCSLLPTFWSTSGFLSIPAHYLRKSYFFIIAGHKDYNNHVGAYIAGTQNSTGANIIANGLFTGVY